MTDDPPHRVLRAVDGQEYDPIAAMIAALDQVRTVVPQIAELAKAWFDGFVEQGFESKQALYLTAAQILQSPGQAP